MNITVIGLDIAKKVFHLIGLNRAGKVVLKRKLNRNRLLAFIAKQKPCCLSMEACATSHH